VCLLIALSRVVPGAPLIMAANRDEFYGRPAVTMTTLRDAGPRVLGGRDELAGGTWLAVNEHGVVAGLTNQPTRRTLGARDLTKRSRGELPLAFAAYSSAEEAVTQVCATLDPAAYNPCWLLVGDRHALFSVGLAGGQHPEVERLAPGVHVLENLPLGAPSAKVEQVTALVARERAARAARDGRPAETAESAADALAEVLRDHEPATELAVGENPARPLAFTAACVHGEEYGTRSALIVTVPAVTGTPGSVTGTPGEPRLRVADGPPCEVPFRDMTALWEGPALV
jgi:uncharacterized protein with NRDE domain